MGAYRFTNNAESTLSGALTAGNTALTVASAAAFPTAGNFTIVVDSEIMLVTGVAGATFTIVRAQEGTSAAAHVSGAIVRHVVTADALTSGFVPSGTSFPTSPSTGDRFYRTDRRLEYVYDASITRWLTTQVFTDDFRAPDGTTANGSVWGATWLSFAYDMYLVSLEAAIFVGTTNDINNYWALVLRAFDGAAATTTYAEANSASQAANTMVLSHTAINQVLSAGSGVDALVLQLTKAGSGTLPGPLYAAAKLIYRLAG